MEGKSTKTAAHSTFVVSFWCGTCLTVPAHRYTWFIFLRDSINAKSVWTLGFITVRATFLSPSLLPYRGKNNMICKLKSLWTFQCVHRDTELHIFVSSRVMKVFIPGTVESLSHNNFHNFWSGSCSWTGLCPQFFYLWNRSIRLYSPPLLRINNSYDTEERALDWESRAQRPIPRYD